MFTAEDGPSPMDTDDGDGAKGKSDDKEVR